MWKWNSHRAGVSVFIWTEEGQSVSPNPILYSSTKADLCPVSCELFLLARTWHVPSDQRGEGHNSHQLYSDLCSVKGNALPSNTLQYSDYTEYSDKVIIFSLQSMTVLSLGHIDISRHLVSSVTMLCQACTAASLSQTEEKVCLPLTLKLELFKGTFAQSWIDQWK